MPSFNAINYSIRPSKSIQRQIVFDCLSELESTLGLRGATYIGLGSIWFTDFVLAHTKININRMISIEEDEVGYKRAMFNKPYSVVSVKRGSSSEVIPALLKDKHLSSNPWVVWLDFDYELDSSVAQDIRSLVESAPVNSVLIFTVDARSVRYGDEKEDRIDSLRDALGAVVPDDLTSEQCRGLGLQLTLANLSFEYMMSVVVDVDRSEGFVPVFLLPYEDSARMITFGVVLHGVEHKDQIQKIIGSVNWLGMVDEQITAPHLTIKEATELQSLLPADRPITRSDVQKLGFDLSDSQIAIFQKYYKQYPSFAQVML